MSRTVQGRDVQNSNGPSDSKSIMFKIYASNWTVIPLTAGSMLGMVAFLWIVATLWSRSIGPQPPEEAVLIMVILLGALGGLLHLTSSLAKFVGNRQFLRSWTIYYVLMPFEGATLAPVTYLLLRVGILSPGIQNVTANVNVYAIYAFSLLTGLFSKQAIDMLADVFSVIFKKIRAKDALQEDIRSNLAGHPYQHHASRLLREVVIARPRPGFSANRSLKIAPARHRQEPKIGRAFLRLCPTGLVGYLREIANSPGVVTKSPFVPPFIAHPFYPT